MFYLSVIYSYMCIGLQSSDIIFSTFQYSKKKYSKTHWHCHWNKDIFIFHRGEEHFHVDIMLKWDTLSMKFSSGCRRSSLTDWRTAFSSSGSLFLGTSSWGKRSLISPRNIGTSLVTILGRLKSLSARISTLAGNDSLGVVMQKH